MFTFHDPKNIRQSNVLCIICQMDHSIHIVSDSLIHHRIFINSITDLIQRCRKYKITDNRCYHKKQNPPVYTKHHSPRYHNSYCAHQNRPYIIYCSNQPCICILQRHHIFIIELRIFKARKRSILRLGIYPLIKPLINVNIRFRLHTVLIPTVEHANQ